MAKCSACGRFMAVTDGIKCTKCSSVSHRECLGMPEGAEVTEKWRCFECKKKEPKLADTPIRGLNESYFIPSAGPAVPNVPIEANTGSTASESDVGLVEELRLFREEMRSVRQEMVQFRCILANITSSINLCDQRIDKLEGRVEAVESRADHGSAAAVSALEGKVAQLEADLNDRDQELLLNDVEIAGIPEAKGEGVSHIILAVAKKLGVALVERDLVSAERVGPVRPGGLVEGGAPAPARPRPIVARVARRVLKEQLVRAARVRRGATTEDMDLPGAPRPFFVNDRLTRTNRHLFKKAREIADREKWRYVWTRDGRIYVRRQEKTDRHRLRTEEDLERVFGRHRVGS